MTSLKYSNTRTLLSTRSALSAGQGLGQFGGSKRSAQPIARAPGARGFALRRSKFARLAESRSGRSTISRFAFVRTSARLSVKPPAGNQSGKPLLRLDQLKACSPITSRPGTSFVQPSASNVRRPTERLKAHTSTTTSLLECAGFAARVTFDGIKPSLRTPLTAFQFKQFTGQKAEMLNG